MASMDNQNSVGGVNEVSMQRIIDQLNSTNFVAEPNAVQSNSDCSENNVETGTPNVSPSEENTPAADENVCPMCCEKKPAQDDDGHCSYACASGGGKSASNEVIVKPIAIWQPRCLVCYRYPSACECTEDDFYQAALDGVFDEEGYVDSP